MRTLIAACTVLLTSVPPSAWADTDQVHGKHGIAMHGDVKYGPDFRHFDYVNPAARKAGEMKQAALGTFDSFNPFIIKGNAAAGIGQIYDTLLTPAADEPFSEYSLLAETVETPEDRSWVAFTLRESARWHDGKPVTADDVIWSFDALRTKGNPFYRAYYSNVETIERVNDRKVRFVFKPGENRELPLILGQLVVLPKHYWAEREFDKTSLDPPLGSGPYAVDGFEPGRWVRYRRVDDYWGKDLPVNAGRNNVDVIRYDYYRDDTVALEAFKAGAYDLRVEMSAKEWATSYEVPALRSGLLRKEEIPNERPAGMQGFAYNTRRPLFRDRRVRQALAYAFDFDWSNKHLFYGQYKRTRSYFDNSELAASGLPTRTELDLLEPYRDRVPDEVFGREYQPPGTDTPDTLRERLLTAVELLREAGWTVDKETRKLTHAETRQVFSFEFLIVQPAFERVVLPFAKNVERLGIDMKVRVVDTAQYQRRMDDFDFDMAVGSWAQSLSPGNEQRNYWASEYADRPGSQNLIGIKDPVVDGLVEKMIAAPDRESLVARVRALDRVLQWGHYVIPNWHLTYDRIAYWNKFERPAVTPAQGAQLDTWWIDAGKAAILTKAGK